MSDKPETKINPAWEALKPEDGGKTWFKLEDCMPGMSKDAYKVIEISPDKSKPE